MNLTNIVLDLLLSYPWSLATFAVSALAIWLAGTSLERHANAIAKNTSLSTVVAGLMLAVSTSLPELATSVSASLSGSVSLATHNLLGGVVFQTAILFIADAVFRRGALTAFAANYILLLQGVALIATLALVLVAIAVETAQSLTFRVFGTSIWLWLLLPITLGALRVFTTYRKNPAWQPREGLPRAAELEPETENREMTQRSPALWLKFSICSLVILFAGWLCATSADAISQQTGIATSFMGFALVSMATSLPEVSTVVSSVRRGSVAAAVSNVLGSNIFDSSLLVPVSLCSGGVNVFAAHLTTNLVAATFGILLTCVYLWGLMERKDRTIFKIGIDSYVVLGIAILANWLIFYLG